jgi:hypothetical protein
MAEGKDSALQHNSLFRVINITSLKSNPTSAPTFYSRVTYAVCQPRSSFDWMGQGCWAGVRAPWASMGCGKKRSVISINQLGGKHLSCKFDRTATLCSQ